MDYRAFYADVALWIEQNQQQSLQLGFGSQAYFDWVFLSAGELGNKYQNTKLVVKQMCMLLDWIEESYKEQKRSGNK